MKKKICCEEKEKKKKHQFSKCMKKYYCIFLNRKLELYMYFCESEFFKTRAWSFFFFNHAQVFPAHLCLRVNKMCVCVDERERTLNEVPDGYSSAPPQHLYYNIPNYEREPGRHAEHPEKQEEQTAFLRHRNKLIARSISPLVHVQALGQQQLSGFQ